MKNPFPGLNPYLQQRWSAAHTSLIVYLRDQIQSQLPEGLSATIEEGVSIDIDAPGSDYRPDVHVHESWDAPESSGAGGLALAPPPQPVVVKRRPPPKKQRHIEILDTTSGERVVTVIEILSPSNKQMGGGAEAYKTKQREILEAGASLVEIDFIRGGSWSPAFGWDELPPPKRPECYACVTRGYDLEQTDIYPFALREPLPNIPLPLRPADRDILLQLQDAMDRTVENSGFRQAHYASPPVPPVKNDDSAWLEEVVEKLRA